LRQPQHARGIVHVHTDLSHDGHLTPARIARMCMDRGMCFAAISDHAEDITSDSMELLVRECNEQSSDKFTLIPGLEHRFALGIHIVVLGQRRLTPPAPILDTLKRLADDGCILIAAHCANSAHIPPDLLRILTAIEIWNIGRDTRYLPTSASVRAYMDCIRAKSDLLAIGGADMHIGREWGCEIILRTPCGADQNAIITQLRSGSFITRGRFVTFPSRPTGRSRLLIFRAGDALARVRSVRDRAQAMIGVKG